MTTFRIEYNPFAGECRFKKQGKRLARDSRLRLKEEERLQALFDKYNDWDGLIEEIKSECDDSEITIEFVGRKIDFEDIVYALKRYEGQNSDNSVTIDTRLIETDKKLEIVNRLDVIIDEIKGKNLPEFQRKNEEGLTVFDIYERVKRGIFELTVVATMSSGKSTLINALLGKELLPSKNEACTASITRIFDNDTCDGFVAECFDKNGATVYSGQGATLEGLRKMNDDERVHTIRIEGDIPFLSSERVKVCINDTPGPNNSRDENHGVLTRSMIKNPRSVIMYVLNVTQLAINDDRNLLQDIASEMRKYGKQTRDKYIFVLNKCDELDPEKGESIDGMTEKAREYLAQFGIENPVIVPVCARLALLIRKKQNGGEFTRIERRQLDNDLYSIIEMSDLHCNAFATTSPTVSARVSALGAEVEDDEGEALIYTGVPVLEQVIAEYVEKYAVPSQIYDAIKDIVAVINEIKSSLALDEKIASDTRRIEELIAQINEFESSAGELSKITENFTQKIKELDLNDIVKKQEFNRKVTKTAMELTNDFNGRSTMSPDEARIWKSNFERAMRTAEENIEAELFRKVDEGVFAQGKSLLHEYRRAVSSILGKFDGSSFNFSANLGASHKISLSEIDNKIAKNTTSEMHTRYVTDTSKAWYKPWTWFKPRLKEEYYSVNLVKISEVVKDCLNLFTTSAYANIDLMIENARAQVRSYKDHFTKSIKSLEKDIAERVKQVKQRTANRDKIQAQVERDRSFKSWIDSCSQGLNAVVGFDMKEI